MPLFIPEIIEEAGAPAATFAGGRELLATATVGQHFRAVLAGGRALVASPSLAGSIAAIIPGGRTLTATGRLNSEANVFGAATFSGARSLATDGGLTVGSQVLFSGGRTLAAQGSLAKAEEFGFTIFLDIAGDVITSAGRARRYAAVLTDGDTSIPARSVTERAAPGALAVTLDVELASPDRAMVAALSDINFEVGQWNGSGFEYFTVLTGGVRSSDTARYANDRNRPADRVSFGALDSLGDRWGLRPDAPTTLFNPDLTDAPAPPQASDAIIGPSGVAIMPIISAVGGLSLHGALNFAYVTGCGFGAVVTNIPDYPVAEVTFTLEGGYHEAVKPLLGLFEPVYFADGNTLWIVDADQPLPAGLAPLALTEADVKTIEDAGTPRTPTDAIIVEYRDTTAQGDYFTERLEIETQEAGTFGTDSFTSTKTTRKVREYRNLTDPTMILREVVSSTIVETTDWNFEVTGRETQTDAFDALGRKSGHARTVESRVPDPADRATLSLQTVSQEKYSVFYRPGLNQASDELASTVNQISGLVLADSDKPYLDKPYEIPYRDAHASGYIDPDANQAATFQTISTVIENYVGVGAETQVRRQTVSHLNGGSVENTVSQTRAGTTTVSRRAQRLVRRMVTLAPLEPGKGRVIPTFSAGEIPASIALQLAKRKLMRLNNPPRQVTINLPYVDFRIRRGVVVEARARGGVSLGNFLVEGYTRTYEQLDGGGQKFSTTLNARQLTAAI